MIGCNLVLNYETLLQIDINYGGTPNWVSVKKGITGVTPVPNEVVSQKQYVDGEGHAESHVTGGQLTIAVTGDRFINDAAQDYIFNRVLMFGCSRDIAARYVDELGGIKEGTATLVNITPANGDPASEGAISFEIHFKGKPTIAPPVTAPTLTATVAAGSVAGTTKATVTAGAGNTLGYFITSAQPSGSVNEHMYVNVTGYTSGADIPVVADQYLNLFELDSDKRIVKYFGQVITSGDIA